MFSSLLPHLFFPTHRNSHRAHFSRPWALLLAAALIVFFRHTSFDSNLSDGQVLGYASRIDTDKVIELTNLKRKEVGAGSLTKSDLLTTAAKLKGEHMLKFGYWAHVSPDGTEPWDFFRDVGYRYRFAGENLARDFDSSQGAIDGWMASLTHRENMLSPKYTDIGVAVVEGNLNGREATIIVQLFGTPSSVRSASVTSGSKDEVFVNKPEKVETTVAQKVEPEIILNTTENKPVVGSIDVVSPPTYPTFDQSKIFTGIILAFFTLVIFADWMIMRDKRHMRKVARPLGHFMFLLAVFIFVMVVRQATIL